MNEKSFSELDFVKAFAKPLRDTVIVTSVDLDLPGPEILYVNPAFTQATGYRLEDVIGKTPRILQGVGTDSAELARMRESLKSEEQFFGSVLNYTKDGREIIFDWHISPIRDLQGVVKYWVSVQHGTPELAHRSVRSKLHAVIVHRDAVTRIGLREILKLMTFELSVQEVSSYDEVAQVIDKNGVPDLVLAETTPSDFGGADDLLALRRLLPTVPVLSLSAVDDERTLRAALNAGVNAYVPMTTASQLMLEILRVVLAGGTFIPWEQVNAFGGVERVAGESDRAESLTKHPVPSHLTRRQSEIGAMLAQGLSNDQIAARLGLNLATVKGHVTRTLKALGVRNRTQAALLFKGGD